LPDGELHELGAVVSRIQASGFEVRHVEGLREHDALTFRAWVANLERSWDEAVLEAGDARARIWRLYMAASALNFEAGRTQIHQVLAVKSDDGASGLRSELGSDGRAFQTCCRRTIFRGKRRGLRSEPRTTPLVR
jgi:hypothetical protein